MCVVLSFDRKAATFQHITNLISNFALLCSIRLVQPGPLLFVRIGPHDLDDYCLDAVAESISHNLSLNADMAARSRTTTH
jgi:hypothetical protein